MMEAIPAATMILWRDTRDAGEERVQLLMVRRSERLAFAGGAMAFPGGRTDPDDWTVSKEGLDHGDAAGRVTAVRETLEECGIAVGIHPSPTSIQVERWRALLRKGDSFSSILASEGHRIDFGQLVPFTRWLPPTGLGHSRIFDTRFYLAKAQVGEQPCPDGSESIDALWIGPQTVLAAAERGEALILYPTRCNLQRISQLADYESAIENAKEFPARLIQPVLERADDGEWLTIPPGLGYDIIRARR
jgi:8-oxo-dGTP pyrophosphatase MutT (NUDIX family)